MSTGCANLETDGHRAANIVDETTLDKEEFWVACNNGWELEWFWMTARLSSNILKLLACSPRSGSCGLKATRPHLGKAHLMDHATGKGLIGAVPGMAAGL